MIEYLHRFIKNLKTYPKKHGIISLEEHQDAVQCIVKKLQMEHSLHNQSQDNSCGLYMGNALSQKFSITAWDVFDLSQKNIQVNGWLFWWNRTGVM